MAYMDQARKNRIAPHVKHILASYGLKGSLAVRNHMELVLTIRSGSLDFIGNFNRKSEADGPVYGVKPYKIQGNHSVNQYWLEREFTGTCLKCLEELRQALNDGNWDNSNAQVDHFDVGWYITINIGTWKKPYEHTT